MLINITLIPYTIDGSSHITLIEWVEVNIQYCRCIFSKYTPSILLLCDDYNIHGVDWFSDELRLIASGNLNHTSHSIIEYFSYPNFFNNSN